MVLRYDGTTGAFIDAFVAPGSGGLDDPAGILFVESVASDVPTLSEWSQILLVTLPVSVGLWTPRRRRT